MKESDFKIMTPNGLIVSGNAGSSLSIIGLSDIVTGEAVRWDISMHGTGELTTELPMADLPIEGECSVCKNRFSSTAKCRVILTLCPSCYLYGEGVT